MDFVSSEETAAARGRRRQTAAIKESLRGLSNQLAMLNHQVSTHLELRDVDLDCLELISRLGPLSPSAVARHAGLHPATVTGILDRLERGGWVARERDPDAADRRSVLVRAQRDRGAEVFRLYSPMNTLMDQICAGYADTDLELLADFLRRATSAGRDATDELAAAEAPGTSRSDSGTDRSQPRR